MWKSAVGAQINISDQKNEEDDEWETDPDYVNDVNEEEQRWGGSGGRTAGAINMDQLRKETEEADTQKKKKELLEGTHNPSFGYGGKFGVEKDRMDSSAMGHEYIAKVEKHASQKDYSAGFGGKFGVQTDRVDQSALSWDHKEKLVKHASQKDYVSGFGGKFGVQSDRQDKSAVGWDHIEKVEKHESQKDYSKGFGGKFGVQSDRQDKSAVGWDHHEASQKHESQTDHKIGFGGKFGVQTDRVDKSAANFNEEPQKVGTNYTKVKPDIGGAKPSDLKARFETMGSQEAKKAPPTTGAPKKSIHAKAAMFSQKPSNEESATQPSEVASKPKQLDQSKLAQFNNATTANVQSESKSNQIKDEIAQLKQKQEQKSPPATIIKEPKREPEIVLQKQEQEQIPEPQIVVQKQEQEQILEKVHLEKPHQEEPPRSEEIYQNVEVIQESAEAERQEQELLGDIEEPEYYSPDEIVDTGISATALYDYQAAAEDEISFDPDDEITHIEQIDEGWWRGLCKGKYGLFPANYVQVRE